MTAQKWLYAPSYFQQSLGKSLYVSCFSTDITYQDIQESLEQRPKIY